MGQKHQRGWLKKEARSPGETWVLFFRRTRASDGKRVQTRFLLGWSKTFPRKATPGLKSRNYIFT